MNEYGNIREIRNETKKKIETAVKTKGCGTKDEKNCSHKKRRRFQYMLVARSWKWFEHENENENSTDKIVKVEIRETATATATASAIVTVWLCNSKIMENGLQQQCKLN